ncbi:MAG: hypothetical protein HFACDABA_00791 [Anaerolineales bacterium]|nr:hypothetical protein [Anaerolineales bacterium]
MREKIIVDKLSPQGELKWRYEGEVIARDANSLILEAFFDRDDAPFMDTILKRGDRFVETYYADRGFNIYEIYDRDDHSLKGYYCNIALPARFSEGRVEYADLYLDLWVSADGTQTVLDEDEFLAAELDEGTRLFARQALEELQAFFQSRQARRSGL